MLFLPSWLRINEPALKAEHLRITPSLPFQKHVVQTQNYFEKAVLRRKISRGMEYVLLYRISILLLSLQYRFKTK